MFGEKIMTKQVGLHNFSERELDVLACAANGCSYKRAAILLNISPRTTETHMRHLLSKFGCFTREEMLKIIRKTEHKKILLTRYVNITGIDDSSIDSKKKTKKFDKKKIIIGLLIFIIIIMMAGVFFVCKRRGTLIDSPDPLAQHIIVKETLEKGIEETLRTQYGVTVLALIVVTVEKQR
jgi:DNA-binding CsgD family transcriptional regulator